MSGDNAQTAPPSNEGAAPAVEKKENASATNQAEPTEKSAAEPKAAADTTAESDKAAEASAEKPAEEQGDKKPDAEMTDAVAPSETAADAAEGASQEKVEEAEDAAGASASKSKAKRKSIGAGESKGKKLNKKQSKQRVLHLDAKPGEHYFVKLKGHPQWPVIICDEDMLPASLLKTRPVTAKRADGSYREDFADGGKKVADRTFPVMYLETNEFGWVPNSELIDLDPATVLQDVKLDKMKKSLQAAYKLAAENHPLSYYKELLQSYQEDLIQQEKAKAAKAAAPKGKKGKATSEEDEDVEMEDAPSATETSAKDKKSKKRKAEDNAETLNRTESAKKPKIKLTTSSTPKANGSTAASKSSGKGAETKSAKSKTKKGKEEEKKVEKEPTTPKEPELTPEERHQKKEKEVLYLRHRLQKGLLTRDQAPKPEEMKLMSDYITKLESFPDLEVSIIRATKINKVLKAILKLESIPREEEFKFKARSQVLLDKWNKLLAVDGTPTAASASEVNGAKSSAKANGVKEKSESAEPKGKDEESNEVVEESKSETKVSAKSESASEAKSTSEEAKAVEASA